VPTREPAAASSPWTWGRLLRIAGFALALLAALDLALIGTERRIAQAAARGALRNTEGRSIVDACLQMLRALPEKREGEVIVVVGASVSFGSNLDPSEALPARLAEHWRRSAPARTVLNCAQPGASTDSSLPVAAAFGTRPVSLLLVEVMVPVFAERQKKAPAPPWSEEEIALLEMATPPQRAVLEEAGRWPPLPDRVEAGLAELVRSNWRLFRHRGPLWIDDRLIPDQLIWTLRREIAAAGFLPRRFHGQTTNVGKLPWRQAYVAGQRPSGAQRFIVPVAEVAEREYASLLRVHRLAELAGVPVAYYEIPLNIAFQREFALMDEAEIHRLESLREKLRERMRADGLVWIDAPALHDDDFLDRAHLTADGSRALAAHLARQVEAWQGSPRETAGAGPR
jgi:hypothetical protein